MRSAKAERNAEIVRRVKAGGETYAEIGADYGISRQRIEQILRREKYQARNAVKDALARGVMERPGRCEECGQDGDIEAHHDDYRRRLRVRWLCRPCHLEADRDGGRTFGGTRRKAA